MKEAIFVPIATLKTRGIQSACVMSFSNDGKIKPVFEQLKLVDSNTKRKPYKGKGV